jgi:glycerophosphoryl diester phosphodiesterase
MTHRTNGTLEVIAHRGLHTAARENTLSAFELAIAAGADAIELDVHATRDDTIVVHHDPGIALEGEEPVSIALHSTAEVRAAASRAGFELPTLDEVFEAVAGRAKIYIEVKALDIELLVSRVLRKTDQRVAVHSFDHRVVRRIRDFVPGIQTGALTVSRPVNPVRLLRDASASDYWPQADFVDSELVSDIHEAGGRVIAWTANRPEQWEHLLKMRVDGICTDRPDDLRKWLT